MARGDGRHASGDGMVLGLIQRLTRGQKRLVLLALDLLLVPVAFAFCFAVQALPLSAGTFAQGIFSILPYLCLAAAGLSDWLGVQHVRLKHFEGRAVGRFGALSASLALLVVPMSLLAGLSLPASTFVLFGLSYFALGTLMRFALRGILVGLYRRAAPRRRVLIYGAGSTGVELISALREHSTIYPVAFVDDNPTLHGVMVAGLPVYSPARLTQLVEDRAIDRVLIAIPSLSQPKQSQIAGRLRAMGLDVQVLPSFSQLIGDEPLIEKFVAFSDRRLLSRDEIAPHDTDGAAGYAGQVVMVAGAGGTIGAELCRQLLSCRARTIVLFEMSEYALYTIYMELHPLAEEAGLHVVPVLGSVTDAGLVRRTLRDHKVDVVLHAAAYKHVPLVEANPLVGIANNVMGTQVLAQESLAAGVARFILVSSDKAVRPTNVMGASKRFAELIVQDIASRVAPGAGPRFAMVRFGNVLGSSGSVVPLFQDQIRRGGPLTVTHADVTRYFMTLQEAAHLVMTAGMMAQGGEVYVLDMGKPVRILDLARQTIQAAGYTVRDEGTPDGDIAIDIIGLRPGEKMHEELMISPQDLCTRHGKIFSTHEDKLSEIEIAGALRALRTAITAHDTQAARRVIEQTVKEYRPPSVASSS
ncbi:MAG: polysaccharide biosynthesis protein [Shimia sp.]